ncbi:hypothetical protein M3J09_006633 [Ascochyta lentis]
MQQSSRSGRDITASSIGSDDLHGWSHCLTHGQYFRQRTASQYHRHLVMLRLAEPIYLSRVGLS